MEADIFKHFKVGDTVCDSPNSIWDNKLFEIKSFHGNDYLPLASAYFVGKPKNNVNMVNLDLREVKLISTLKRPLKNVNDKVLLNLIQKGNIEAERELEIRKNNNDKNICSNK